jgi:hypothetical protein
MCVSDFFPPARNRQENLGRLLHKRCLVLQRKHQISVAKRSQPIHSYLLFAHRRVTRPFDENPIWKACCVKLDGIFMRRVHLAGFHLNFCA